MATVLDQTDYGQVHYWVFHRLLPTTLWEDGLEEFVEICEAGEQGDFLIGPWSELLAAVRGGGEHERLRGAPKVSERSFPVLLDAEVDEHRLIVIGAPPPHMTPQARFIACWFDTSDPQETLRYFAAELPMDPEMFGDVLGEWTSDGSHRNFGTFCAPGDSSVESFANAIVRLCTNGNAPLGESDAGPRRRSKARPRTPSDMMAAGMQAADAALAQIPRLTRDDVRARVARRARAQGEEGPSSRGAGQLTWQSESSRIAADIVGRLRAAQSAGQSVVIASAERATGLREAVSTYLQFKILNKKKLLTEVQGDYSYWGVSVQSRDWTKFTVLGFSSPSSSNGNFSIVYQDFRDDRKLLDWLTHTVSAMQEVLAPEGEISYKGF